MATLYPSQIPVTSAYEANTSKYGRAEFYVTYRGGDYRRVGRDEWNAIIEQHGLVWNGDLATFLPADDPMTDGPTSRWDVYGEPAL